jgi:hypothetical protein
MRLIESIEDSRSIARSTLLITELNIFDVSIQMVSFPDNVDSLRGIYRKAKGVDQSPPNFDKPLNQPQSQSTPRSTRGKLHTAASFLPA